MNGAQEKGAPTDADLLDAIERQFGGDLAIDACIAECRAALDHPDLAHRLTLTKKLSYAISRPPKAPTPTELAVALGTRTLK